MGSIPTQFCTFKAGALARRSPAMDLKNCARPNDNQPSTGPVRGPTRDAAAVSARSARLADEAANFHNDISEV
jgi:hypothetical protein